MLSRSAAPAIIALVQCMDRAEIAAQTQLHRVGGRDRLDLAEQPLGFGEFAEIRLLQRAVQGEFGRVDVGRRLLFERAARQRLEKFGGLGIVAAVIAAIALGEGTVDVDRARQGARKAVVAADRRRRDVDHAGDQLALADRFEREVQRVIIGGKALDRVAGAAVALDAGVPLNVAVLDGAAVGSGADDRARPRALDARLRVGGRGAEHPDIADRLARVAAEDHPGAVEHSLDDRIAHRRLDLAQRSALVADREAVAQRGVAALCRCHRGCGGRQHPQNRQEKRTSSGHVPNPPNKREGAAPARCLARRSHCYCGTTQIPLGRTLNPSHAKGK